MATFDPSGITSFVPSSSITVLADESTLLIFPTTSCCATASDTESRPIITTVTRIFMQGPPCLSRGGRDSAPTDRDPGGRDQRSATGPPFKTYARRAGSAARSPSHRYRRHARRPIAAHGGASPRRVWPETGLESITFDWQNPLAVRQHAPPRAR